MKRRTIGVVLALVAAAAVPLGLPHSVSAAGFTSVVFSPLPIAQPGTLLASTTVDLCVQPESAPGVHTTGTVYLNILAGEFTSPSNPGGTAMVGATALSATPAAFTITTSSTCTVGTSTFPDAILVAYTSASSLPINGRDVISAADSAADNATLGTGGFCPASVPCNTAAYVYSPVASYVFLPGPTIAGTGTLTAGQSVSVTVTAEDGTGHAVPGAYLDLSLTNSGATGGSAVAFSAISGTNKHLTNLPQRIGSLSCATPSCGAGSVAIVYTTANPLPSSGTDTITAQNHPTATLTATDTYTYATSTGPPQGPYTAVTPFRVCDTRPAGPGIVANQCDTGAGSGPISSAATRVITVDNFGGLPASGVTAVVVNLTAIAPTKGTYLAVSPDGVSPGTSNLNPQAGQIRANLVEVGVSTAGKIDVFNAAGSINIALDIEGYVSSASTGLFTGTSPVRICDTRAAGGGVPPNRCNTGGASPIGSGATLTFNVNGSGSPVPGTGVSAVVFNLTAINPSVGTALTAFTGATRPIASNINVDAHAAVPNRVIVPVTCSGGNCAVSIWNAVGSVNIAVDIDGWFTTVPGTQFTALATPARICDTRFGNAGDAGCTQGVVGSGQVLNIEGAGIDGIPADTGGAGSPVAIVANVTAVFASAGTFVTVYPGTVLTHPNASDLNVPSNLPVSNLVVATLGTDGTINLFNAQGGVDLIVDVLGYYS